MGDAPEKRKRKGTGLLIAMFCLGLLAAGLVVFFRVFEVKHVEVQGNIRYTDEEILSLCMNGPLAHNTVLFSTFAQTMDLSDVAFLNHVTVEYVDENSILLRVTETLLVGVFEADGYYYYFDQDGKVTEVLTSPDEEEGKHVPVVRGLGASNIGLEHVIEFEQPGVLNTLYAIRSMIEKYDICPDEVEFDADLNITLVYGDVNVLLGQDVLLEEKMARAAAILPELEDYAGTLHLENYTQETENIVFDISEPSGTVGSGEETAETAIQQEETMLQPEETIGQPE